MNEKVDIPIVSVVMITYNHEAYIEESINGVLIQECDFPVELIIADDCSPDDTESIVRNIIQAHPNGDWIRYTRHKENKGMMPNFIWALQQAQGKYIALCEGDDYWIDPLKLKKQVDFLEAHPEYSFSFHDCEILNQNTGQKTLRVGNRIIDENPDLKSVILENNAPTASIVFKNINWNKLPDWLYKIVKGDYGLVVLIAEQGKGKYFKEPMSVYRVHEGGVWSSQNQEYTYKYDIVFYDYLKEYFKDKEVRKIIKLKTNYTKANYGIYLIRNHFLFKGLWLIINYNNWFLKTKFKISLRKILSAIKSNLIKK